MKKPLHKNKKLLLLLLAIALCGCMETPKTGGIESPNDLPGNSDDSGTPTPGQPGQPTPTTPSPTPVVGPTVPSVQREFSTVLGTKYRVRKVHYYSHIKKDQVIGITSSKDGFLILRRSTSTPYSPPYDYIQISPSGVEKFMCTFYRGTNSYKGLAVMGNRLLIESTAYWSSKRTFYTLNPASCALESQIEISVPTDSTWVPGQQLNLNNQVWDEDITVFENKPVVRMSNLFQTDFYLKTFDPIFSQLSPLIAEGTYYGQKLRLKQQVIFKGKTLWTVTLPSDTNTEQLWSVNMETGRVNYATLPTSSFPDFEMMGGTSAKVLPGVDDQSIAFAIFTAAGLRLYEIDIQNF